MKKLNSTKILILILIIGMSLLLYPTVANWWNNFHQSRAISSYDKEVANIDDDKYDEIWQAAKEYNEKIASNPNDFVLKEDAKKTYESLLNIGGKGIMGYVEIPKIDVELPIYHGTSESAIQVAVGHIEWSSLPVGGASSHCVISSHRGLPSARLFTDIDQLVEGDVFFLHILDETLAYQVDQILIVEPKEVDDLQIEEGKDMVTLVTCTPYGVNTHRLLVRGQRVEDLSTLEGLRVSADAVQIEPLLIAPIVAIPMLLILLIILLLPKKR